MVGVCGKCQHDATTRKGGLDFQKIYIQRNHQDMSTYYIAIRYAPIYDMSEWQILGLFADQETASRTVIKHAMEQLDFNYYDPAKRFYSRTRHSYIEKDRVFDAWAGTIGISEYRVEPRVVGETKVDVPDNTVYFAFDKYIKNRICEENLDREEVRSLLLGWKTDQESREKLLTLMLPKGALAKPQLVSSDEWMKTHGSIKPYPWNDNNCVPEQL